MVPLDLEEAIIIHDMASDSDSIIGDDIEDNEGKRTGSMASLGTVELGEAATAVSAGGHHTCAVLVSGGVKCWGRGNNGQLGYDLSRIHI